MTSRKERQNLDQIEVGRIRKPLYRSGMQKRKNQSINHNRALCLVYSSAFPLDSVNLVFIRSYKFCNISRISVLFPIPLSIERLTHRL